MNKNSSINNIKTAVDKFCSNKKSLGKAILILVILVVALVLRINNSAKNDVTVEVNESDNNVKTEMYVDISGEVNEPGVYAVDSDTRMY